MPHGPSETTRSVQKKEAALVALLSGVEDVDTTGVNPLPFPFPVGAEPFVAPPLRAPASRQVCPSLAAHACAYEPSVKHWPMNSR